MDTLHPVAQEPYRDRKRYAWLFSLLVPSIVGIGPALVLATGDPRMLWIQVVFFTWCSRCWTCSWART